MTAAETAFFFLKRGLDRGLCLSRFATLAYLAAHGEKTRLEILTALGLSVSSRNSGSVVEKLVSLDLLLRRREGDAYSYSLSPKGYKALGLKSPVQ